MATDPKTVALIVGKMKGAKAPAAEPLEGGDDEAMASDGGDVSGEHAAAQEAMDALHSGDVAAFAGALKAFVQMCGSSSELDADDEE